MLGYSPAEVEASARPWEDILHPDDRSGVLETVKANLEGRMPSYTNEAINCAAAEAGRVAPGRHHPQEEGDGSETEPPRRPQLPLCRRVVLALQPVFMT